MIYFSSVKKVSVKWRSYGKKVYETEIRLLFNERLNVNSIKSFSRTVYHVP